MTKRFAIYSILILVLITLVALSGCKKFVELDSPKNQLAISNVFNNDGGATGVVTGIYTSMANSNYFASGGQASVNILSGLSADELINSPTISDYNQFADNSLASSTQSVTALWSDIYHDIYFANVVLDGLYETNGTSQGVRQQLTGEAKFIRAFCYLYLTNLYGDVPLYTHSSYQLNDTASRTPSSLVYSQIVSDLEDARSLMSSDFSFAGGERVRPNKWAAAALLARTYLYMQKWDSAEALSTAVIDNTGQFSLTSLDSVFLANSTEAIWQLLPVIPGLNTQEGQIFILTAPPTFVSLSNFVVNSFETGDNRATSWVNSYSDGTTTWYFPYKYKIQASSVVNEYSMILRLGEQYLIRAEARAERNNLNGAQDDINVIRERAGLSDITFSDKDSALSKILHERQVELFTEWGHRWIDLKRTNMVNTILGTEKPSWKPTAQLYPIPSIEIQNNSRITQNPGY